MCGCLLSAPYRGPGLQPKHMPLLGIEPGNPLVRRLVLNPLSYTSQGKILMTFDPSLISYYLHPLPYSPCSPASSALALLLFLSLTFQHS